MPLPLQYKESGVWVTAKPTIAKASKDKPWWTLYHDKRLNRLEQKLTCDNLNLKIALGRFQEAVAIAQSVRSALYPQVQGIGDVARQKNSITIANSQFTPNLIFNTFLAAGLFTYEIDAWGRVRNAVIASDSAAKASELDLAAIDLSMHAALARDYFQLLGDDEAQVVLDATVVAYEKALYLTRQQHSGGLVPEADLDLAITQLENAKTMATDMRLQRAQMEHAIAVLVGEIPSNFRLKPRVKTPKVVTVAPELPSTLLERRPDIAASAARVQSANASIGVARAAFFPSLNLVTLLGVQSSQFPELFKARSIIWSLGPSAAISLVKPEISQVIFDGYNLQALLSQAKALYFETVNAYRQNVLTAFQEVEDKLVAVRRLDEEIKTQAASTRAAKRALYQANQRWKGGLVTYLNVVISEDKALQSELALITIRTRRQLASVQLIKALGGGWHCGGCH